VIKTEKSEKDGKHYNTIVSEGNYEPLAHSEGFDDPRSAENNKDAIRRAVLSPAELQEAESDPHLENVELREALGRAVEYIDTHAELGNAAAWELLYGEQGIAKLLTPEDADD
jgi:hypothetical protein